MTETSPRVSRLLGDLRGGGPRVIDDFWHEVKTRETPLVEAVDDESALVTFLWRGEAEYTAVAYGVDVALSRIDGTDLWHGSQRLPLDLRTFYYLRHRDDGIPANLDGAGPSHIDPLNPHMFRFPADRRDQTDVGGWVSWLELPSAPDEPWSRPLAGVARGSLLRTSIRTTALGGRRSIVVYRPAGRPKGPVALLVVFDGFASRAVLRIPTTLDNLIAAERIPPTMALFVNAPSGKRRDWEMRPGPAIRNFVLRELMPWARRRWRISDDPQHRVISGASLGGLVAAYIAMKAPHEFGCVHSQIRQLLVAGSPRCRTGMAHPRLREPSAPPTQVLPGRRRQGNALSNR